MAQIKKDAQVLTMKMDRHVHEHLEQFCDESGLSKTKAVEKILGQYFEDYFSKPEKDRKLS